jgi:two-component system chemotaxis sensor kinase CheA
MGSRRRAAPRRQEAREGHDPPLGYHEGGHIIIEIADDGRGLNTARIKQKAIENGLATESELEKMTEAQIHKFIFAAGFSTAAEVTSVSGRGVGMDVVRNNIDQIGGTVDVKSVPGEGSSFTIKIPLTLAIVSALIVEAGGDASRSRSFAVIELVRAQANSEHRIERIKDSAGPAPAQQAAAADPSQEAVEDGRLGSKRRRRTASSWSTQVGNQTFGIRGGRPCSTPKKSSFKPMSSKLRHIAMFSGNTILGDGSVIMIIDPNGNRAGGRLRRQQRQDETE